MDAIHRAVHVHEAVTIERLTALKELSRQELHVVGDEFLKRRSKTLVDNEVW